MFSFCLLTLGVTQVPLLVYWPFSGLLLVVETGKPNFISRYRIQVDNNGCVSVAAAASAGWSTESSG